MQIFFKDFVNQHFAGRNFARQNSNGRREFAISDIAGGEPKFGFISTNCYGEKTRFWNWLLEKSKKILTNWILCAYDVKSFSWPRIQGAGQLVVHLIQCETSCNLIRKCTKVIDPKYYKHLKEPAQHSHFGHIKNWLVSVR